MSEPKRSGPVLLEIDPDAPMADPTAAPHIIDADLPAPAALQRAAGVVSRRSRLGAWVLSLAGAFFSFVIGLAAWDYVTGLLARAPLLGWVAMGLGGALVLALCVVALREVAALARLRRIDRLQAEALAALGAESPAAARAVLARLRALYARRADVAWGMARLNEREAEVMDGDGLIILAEETLIAPLDARARAEVEAAARQVAAVTAVVPLALADVATALISNLRMVRRIAEIYGGRAGSFGSWRLLRTVMTHLVATGAVAVGDDLVGSLAGGGLLSKVSRRFGEGVINGALTARVGLAAIEVCRPLPFVRAQKPSVTALVRRALTGLFGTGDQPSRGGPPAP